MMAMMACHQVRPNAISELPVMYDEMFELTSTPGGISIHLHCTRRLQLSESSIILTIVMEGPEPPGASAGLYWLDVIVDPAIWYCSALVLDLEAFDEPFHCDITQ
jgi:hypothetical protein